MTDKQLQHSVELDDNIDATVGSWSRERVESRSGELSAGRISLVGLPDQASGKRRFLCSDVLYETFDKDIMRPVQNYAPKLEREFLSGDTDMVHEPRWKQTVHEFAKMLRQENLPGLEQIIGQPSGGELTVWAIFDHPALEDRLRAYHVHTSYVLQEGNPDIIFHVVQRRGDPLEYLLNVGGIVGLDTDENMVILSPAEV